MILLLLRLPCSWLLYIPAQDGHASEDDLSSRGLASVSVITDYYFKFKICFCMLSLDRQSSSVDTGSRVLILLFSVDKRQSKHSTSV